MASAAYLIRDGGVVGQHISIVEEEFGTFGGSLDGCGSPENGYFVQDGRIYTDEAYTCIFDLLSFIPSLSDSTKTMR